jgi:hypothetical protein
MSTILIILFLSAITLATAFLTILVEILFTVLYTL